ncbi:MAG: M48 family metallopeptidase [Gammaproteobacteria bacterium]|nr:M48 family metallopeptidase [Gammaproteobacteria bacterium]
MNRIIALLHISILLVVLLLVQACATSPMGRNQLKLLPEDQMQQMGLQAFDSLKKETPLSRDRTKNQFVECVANAVTAIVGGQWEVVVFEDNTPNAFALPGGKIGVHTGILPVTRNQSQLASVIGHEIGHVIAHHGNERASQNLAMQTGMQVASVAVPGSQLGQVAVAALGIGAKFGVLLPFSRTHESEADLIGLEYMSAAGFDPREAPKLWQNMAAASKGAESPEFMSTHPSHATRIQDLTAYLDEVMPKYQQALSQGKRPDCDRFRQ